MSLRIPILLTLTSALLAGGSLSADIAPGDAGWPSAYPAWWYNAIDPANGVIDATKPILNQNNNAVLNQGQLWNIADQAIAELDSKLVLVGGAGFSLSNFSNGTQPNYFAPANLGHLKHVSSKFYDRLSSIDFDSSQNGWPALMTLNQATGYPWSANQTPDNLSPANLGQAKYLFSWDLSNWSLDGLLNPPLISQATTASYVYWLEPATLRHAVVGQIILLEALAGFDGDSVGQLEFYVNDALVGAADVSTPYEALWTPLATGDYSITAQALSGSGEIVVSATLLIQVGADANSNGLSDTWEVTHGVTSGNDDSDGDGLLASEEFEQGVSPSIKDHPAVELSLFNASY